MSKFREPLYELAARLNNIVFSDPTGEVAANFHEQEVLGCIRHYITRPSRQRKLWTVRLFIAGKTRTIGATARGADAARFADMAARQFAKYRKSPVTPDQVETNFDIVQTVFDEANEGEAVALLYSIEKYFLDNGIIQPVSAERAVIRRSRGMKANIIAALADLTESLRLLHEKIDKLESKPNFMFDRHSFKQERPITIPQPAYTAPEVGDPPPGLAPIVTCKNPVDNITGQK